jgi:hypothetical protein
MHLSHPLKSSPPKKKRERTHQNIGAKLAVGTSAEKILFALFSVDPVYQSHVNGGQQASSY